MGDTLQTSVKRDMNALQQDMSAVRFQLEKLEQLLDLGGLLRATHRGKRRAQAREPFGMDTSDYRARPNTAPPAANSSEAALKKIGQSEVLTLNGEATLKLPQDLD